MNTNSFIRIEVTHSGKAVFRNVKTGRRYISGIRDVVRQQKLCLSDAGVRHMLLPYSGDIK